MSDLIDEPKDCTGAAEYRPTWPQRIWRALGWRYRHFGLPETPEVAAMPGWALTAIRVEFSLLDRLRLLLTGRVKFEVRQAFDVPVGEVVSAASIEIKRPGDWT